MTAALLLLVLGDGPKPEVIKEPPKDLGKSEPRLTGTWLVVAAVKEGDTLTPEQAKGLTVILDAGSITVQDALSLEKATHVLDRTARPKAIDILSERAPKEGLVRGVYELDGDSLKLAWARPGTARPRSVHAADFPASELPNLTFLVLKRKK